MAIPGMVLVTDRAAAPSAATARAISPMSATVGASLTQTGRSDAATTARVTAAAASGRVPNWIPPALMLGHEMFSSRASMDSSRWRPSVTATYSSTDRPITLTTIGQSIPRR